MIISCILKPTRAHQPPTVSVASPEKRRKSWKPMNEVSSKPVAAAVRSARHGLDCTGKHSMLCCAPTPGQFNALYCQWRGAVGFMKRHLHEGPLLTQPTLLEIFSQIKDHRRAEGKLYPLPQILLFCLLAMLAGATSYRKMHEFIVAHFRRLSLLFPSKMLKAPCYVQIRNIMAGLDPSDMEQAFRRHADGLSGAGADGLKLLAVDGKSLRGSFDALKDKKATQILSVFATDGSSWRMSTLTIKPTKSRLRRL
jgi:hypothetical protein